MLDLTVKQAFNCSPKIPTQSRILLDISKSIPNLELPERKTPTEIGIEIEAERVTTAPEMYAWSVTNDGSLKDMGKEFVSTPLRDTTFYAAMEEFDRKIIKTNKELTFTHRCSMHVHINVAKLTLAQLHSLIATYICVEELLFNLVRDERKGNSYCWPLADACLNRASILPGMVTEQFKYAALNPHHLRDFGTLEFRQHGGTKDKKEIIDWVEIILQLYRFVERFTPDEIQARIGTLNSESTYEMFCRDIFEDHYSHFAGKPLHRMMRNNVTAAKLFLE